MPQLSLFNVVCNICFVKHSYISCNYREFWNILAHRAEKVTSFGHASGLQRVNRLFTRAICSHMICGNINSIARRNQLLVFSFTDKSILI